MSNPNNTQPPTPTMIDEKATAERLAKDKKYRRWVFAGLGVVAVFFVLIVMAVNSATSAPVAVSNQYIDSIQAGNATIAYELMADEAKKTIPEDEFTALVENIGPILNTQESMTNKEIQGETGQAATAQVSYKIKGTDGITYNITVNLVKQGEDWKVMNFESKKD